jgi:hypothetical protein
MPKLTNRSTNAAVKLLLMGDSGTGKTASLLSLAEAGYQLRLADFDNGISILADLARDKPETAGRIDYATFTDEVKATKGGEIIPAGQPRAYSNFVKMLSSWKDEDTDLGPMQQWSTDSVLVIDSLTFLCNAVMRWHLFQVGRVGNPYQQDWLVAQRKVSQLLELLYSSSCPCNVVVNAHIRFIDIAEDYQQGYPESVGKALPPAIPRFFNTVLQAKIKGSGNSAKRRIRVVPDTSIGLKNAAPSQLSDSELPLESGLATIFAAIRGQAEASSSASKGQKAPVSAT